MPTALPPVPTFKLARTPEEVAKQVVAIQDYLAQLKNAIEKALP